MGDGRENGSNARQPAGTPCRDLVKSTAARRNDVAKIRRNGIRKITCCMHVEIMSIDSVSTLVDEIRLRA